MKVVLIGANGQLGTDLNRTLAAQGTSVKPFTHNDLDVRDTGKIENVISSAQPDAVISTAAFHKVEVCETEPETSFSVNSIAPRNLALACRRHNAVLVNFSTDYVFDGAKRQPYLEEDRPSPLNVYGVSKLAGEYMLALTWERHFIVRTCGLYGVAGSAGKGGNFVETMLKKGAAAEEIRVVSDQVLTPTFTGDLAEAVAQLIKTDAYGLYHVTAEGECSWHQFAQKIFELEGLRPKLSPVSSSEFASPVRRPSYSVLSKEKVSRLGIKMSAWEEGLRRYLAARRQKKATPV
ncbi:MAG TPA: dTDP-4-dehydrorhamnose reductase [Terriglobales bacterium]|nr:dTDP-4-dehydrorhamnose reductase [Terriglobales bacterium]